MPTPVLLQLQKQLQLFLLYLVYPDFVENIKVFEDDVDNDQENQTKHYGHDDVIPSQNLYIDRLID